MKRIAKGLLIMISSATVVFYSIFLSYLHSDRNVETKEIKLKDEENKDVNKIIIEDTYKKFLSIVEKAKLDKIVKQKQKNVTKKSEYKTNSKQKTTTLSRGGEIEIAKEVECHITYYTNANTRQEGGKYDKNSKLLDSHDEPICALPKEIPYGYYLILNEEVNGSKVYKNVDTGGAIRWLNKEKTKMKVDIFIPDVTEKWLYNNTKKTIVKGWIVDNYERRLNGRT